jgi:hypothetical protein
MGLRTGPHTKEIEMFLRLIAALVTAFALIASVATAANGGNSANAKKCHQGGYITQARTEAPTTAFASAGECTSYASKGGTLIDLQTARSAQEICEGFPGASFQASGAGWDCAGAPSLSESDFAMFTQAMDAVCDLRFEASNDPAFGFFRAICL